MKKQKTQSEHYVNNAEFLAAMVEYRNLVIAAQQEGVVPPQVPEYIGNCIIKIANHLSTKANFASYTFRDEMILDGIENCLTYLGNFDPAKSSNPFAYFTQICYYAFVRRIQKEKKQVSLKAKYAELQLDRIPSDLAEILQPIFAANVIEMDRDYVRDEEDMIRPKIMKRPKYLEQYDREDDLEEVV